MISFSDIDNFLKQSWKNSGGHKLTQCPYCKDSSKDNLVFTSKNGDWGLLTCFADSDHSRQILSDIAKVKREYTPVQQESKQNPEPVKENA